MKIKELGQIKYYVITFSNYLVFCKKKTNYILRFSKIEIRFENIFGILPQIGLESENWYLKQTLCTLAFLREK